MQEAPHTAVLSLGSFCLTAKALAACGLRAFASPLDWTFSTPGMATHCVKDDWRAFLDTTLLYLDQDADDAVNADDAAAAKDADALHIDQGAKDSSLPSTTRTHHRLYTPMVNSGGRRKRRRCVFPHRSPLVLAEHEYYTRCVERLRRVAADPSAHALLVVAQSSRHRSAHAAWAAPFAALFAALEAHWAARFELLVIRLQRLQRTRGGGPAPGGDGNDGGDRGAGGVGGYDYDRAADELPLAPGGDARFANVPAARDFGGKVSARRGNVLRVVYLDCVGGHDGADFAEACDHDAFCATVRAGREFALQADPVAAAAVVAAGGLAGGGSISTSTAAELEQRGQGDPRAKQAKAEAKERRRAAFEAAGGAARFKKKVTSRVERRAQQERERAAKEKKNNWMK